MRASQWISENMGESIKIEQGQLDAVSDFTLMWALFEASESEEESNMFSKIKGVSEKVVKKLKHSCSLDDFLYFLDKPLNYWSKRYIRDDEHSDRYEHLGLNDEAIRVVLPVLKGKDDNPAHKICACLYIVYRYRNNLFHGNKDITLLEDQTENLNNASELLQEIMRVSNKCIYLNIKK